EAGRGLPPQENTHRHLQVKMNTVQNGKGSKPRNNWGKNWDASCIFLRRNSSASFYRPASEQGATPATLRVSLPMRLGL
ncbi:MAG: hypothetical protein ACLQVW_18060, partial [Limisphaerales bacterium]